MMTEDRSRDVRITLHESHIEIDEAASRRERAIAKAILRDQMLDRADLSDDERAAVKVAADVLDVLETMAAKREAEAEATTP